MIYLKLGKKIISLILVGAIFFTACDSNGGEDETDPDLSDLGSDIITETDEEGNTITVVPSDTEETEATTPDPNAPRYTKVGFIYANSAQSDTEILAFEQARYDIQRTQLDLDTCYVDNVLVQQFQDAVDALKEAGCDVIVAASAHYVNACELAAKSEEGDVVYISYGGSTTLGNLAAIQPQLYQPANVCGVVAAYNTTNNKVGLVVDNNIYHARGVADAFALGVAELPNARITLSLKWALSDSYDDTKKSIDKLVADGCDVIFLYQSTEYGIRYCEEKGVKVIGFSQIIPELAPTQYLTGYSLKLNSCILDLVRKKQYGSFRGSYVTEGLQTQMTGMIMLNQAIIKQGTQEISDALFDVVYDGRSKIFTGEIRDNTDTVRVDKGAALTTDQIFKIDWVVKSIMDIENMSGVRNEEDLYYSSLEVKS